MNGKSPDQMTSGNFFRDFINQIKLIVRLIGDSRVHPLLKILPLFPTIYFIFPDLLLGPLDDGLLMWLGGYLFIELCPPEIVHEHRCQLFGIHPEGMEGPDSEPIEVIDAKFRDDDE